MTEPVARISLLPRTLTIAGVTQMYGWGRTKTYDLIRSGRLKAIKIDSMTLVTRESCEQLIAEAPPASIGANVKRT
jgi:hypothetical protein